MGFATDSGLAIHVEKKHPQSLYVKIPRKQPDWWEDAWWDMNHGPGDTSAGEAWEALILEAARRYKDG
jgi:hypothetical protein